MASSKRRRAASGPIEWANQKSDAAFVKAYLEPAVPGLQPWRTSWTHPKTGQVYTFSLHRSANAGEAVLDACYDLVEQTSRSDYDASAAKWRPAAKRSEMREADLRYILVRADTSADKYADGAHIAAFTSLMPTYEEGHAVVYCYEIHLQRAMQSTGLGALLLGFQSIVAANLGAPVSKVMLTCFVANTHALAFYRRQGYETDASSPATRTLRGGKTFVPDYMILSRGVSSDVSLRREACARGEASAAKRDRQPVKPAKSDDGS